MQGIKRIFKKMQKNFQKPLDKSKIYAIIKVQKERNQQKMFGDFKKANKARKVQWTTELEADAIGKVPQGRGERKKERRVRKAMIPSQDEAIA